MPAVAYNGLRAIAAHQPIYIRSRHEQSPRREPAAGPACRNRARAAPHAIPPNRCSLPHPAAPHPASRRATAHGFQHYSAHARRLSSIAAAAPARPGHPHTDCALPAPRPHTNPCTVHAARHPAVVRAAGADRTGPAPVRVRHVRDPVRLDGKHDHARRPRDHHTPFPAPDRIAARRYHRLQRPRQLARERRCHTQQRPPDQTTDRPARRHGGVRGQWRADRDQWRADRRIGVSQTGRGAEPQRVLGDRARRPPVCAR